MKVWFDEEGDFLEVRSEEKEGFFKDLGNGIFKRIDKEGNTIGFAILNVRKKSKEGLEIPFNAKFKEKVAA